MAGNLSFSLDKLNGSGTGNAWLAEPQTFCCLVSPINTTILRPHLEVDVPTAVAGKAGPLQFQQGLLVGSLDGKPRQERVPVLFDVAYGGARRCLDLHL